ncbi:hypothetical protein FBU30_003879 [Linnemannia zychae]|nr:hypothetical protein FBU30_003879 [Linnemannia zychae]
MILGRDVRILQNHKFLAGSLGLGSGVMIFTSFYNLLPEAKEQLSSDLSIFAGHADAFLMLFYFSGIGVMSLIHWIIHRFESTHSTSPGIENTRAIQQFMQREAASSAAMAAAKAGRGGLLQGSSASLLPQYLNGSGGEGLMSTGFAGVAAAGSTAGGIASSSSTVILHPNHIHKRDGCIQEVDDEDEDANESDEDGEDRGETEEERYNDSEYVDDEVTSLLNNAFLQIGKTPNSQLDGVPHMKKHRHRNGIPVYDDDGDNSDDSQSIEVVITDQRDGIHRRSQDRTNNAAATIDTHSDLDLDLDLDDIDIDGHRKMDGLHGHEKSWSPHTPKPFAPVNKKKKATAGGGGGNSHAGRKPKGSKHTKECHLDHTHNNNSSSSTITPPTSVGSGHRPFRQFQQSPNYGSISTPNGHNNTFSRSDQATHLRRTSFPRLKGGSSVMMYSAHDNLDHAIADDREHADLKEIGIQTALTIAIHKFPEGLITFLSTTADPCLGLSVFMAIAVHNIIEGYLIAFPLYIGLHSRSKAFALAAVLGGLSQPLGAILGWFILRKVASMGWQVSATGCIYAMVAGMMSSIVVNGMWPQAVKCVGRNPTKVVQFCFFAGIAIMGICQTVMGSKCDF